MRNINRRLADFTGVLFGCLLWGMASAAVTEATAEPFDPAQIENFCSQYEQISDSAQIEAIQVKLKAGGYYQGEITGKMDEVTTDALARLCQDSGDAGPFEYLAANPQGKAAGGNEDPLVPEDEAKALCDASTIIAVMKEYEKTVDKERISEIQQQLKIGGYDPGTIDGVTGKDTDSAFAQLCINAGVAEYFEARDYADAGEAEKRLAGHLVDLVLNPKFNLDGGDCGCSRDFSALVYGFFPYLLAAGEAREIDFSLLKRIGVYALVLDKTGEIPDDLQWRGDNANIADFIHEARKHRVKVDLSFYLPKWREWDFGTIDKAAKNIAATIDQKFHGTDHSFWQKILRLVGGTSTVSASGVNLHFDLDAGDIANLPEIVIRVAEKLEESGSDVKLNIMLDLDLNKLDKNEKRFTDLQDILIGDAALVDNVFIFLPKNSAANPSLTSDSKKNLRRIVENAYHGENRIKVLRKIVPIISPVESDFESLVTNDRGDSQFDDDLLYLKDNFFGAGLWPLPLSSDKHEEAIRNALIDNYQTHDELNYLGEVDEDNHLGEILENNAPGLCKFVCPNRLYFQIGLGLLIAILLICAVLALVNCRLRETFQRYFLLFVAMFLSIPLVFVLTLVCDPAWEKDVDRVVIVILLLFIAGFVWRSLRKAVQPKLP